ncbi:hypothetical protein HMPREF0972_02312 [Actinomyces sp. oral taxon 848 str. F0332]|nr:hypothetical protein HMPREF0972_02312 [Actinomyces sp. oral taxon 848 str. F0332]
MNAGLPLVENACETAQGRALELKSLLSTRPEGFFGLLARQPPQNSRFDGSATKQKRDIVETRFNFNLN